jgi:hypothetical protein
MWLNLAARDDYVLSRGAESLNISQNMVINEHELELCEYFDSVMFSFSGLSSMAPWNRRGSEPSLTADDITTASTNE